MGKVKNLFKYIGIVLGICAAIFVVALAAMMIFGFTLFGYKYTKVTRSDSTLLSCDNKEYSNLPDFTTVKTTSSILNNVQKITINSSGIDVEIKPYVNGFTDGDPDKGVTIGPYKLTYGVNLVGFVKAEEEFSVKVNMNPFKVKNSQGIDITKYELKIDITAPTGLVLNSSSKITLYTPFLSSNMNSDNLKNNSLYYDSDSSTFAFNSGLKTEHKEYPDNADDKTKENIDKGNDEIDKENELAKIQTNSINKLHLTDITINAGSGDVTISDNMNGSNTESYASALIYADNVNVTTTSGNQTFSRCGIKNITSKTESGTITFSNLLNGSITGNIDLTNETGNVKFEQGTNIGYLTNPETYSNNINNVDSSKEFLENFNRAQKSTCKITGKNAKLDINSIVNCSFEYVGNADYININSCVLSQLAILSNSAHININDIFGFSGITLSYNTYDENSKNDSGNRTINIGRIECFDSVNLSTWSGNIDIGTFICTDKDKISTITSESGNIKISNLIGRASITSTKGNITIGQQDYYSKDDLTTKSKRLTELAELTTEIEFKALIDAAKNNVDYYEYLKTSHKAGDVNSSYVINTIETELENARNVLGYTTAEATVAGKERNGIKGLQEKEKENLLADSSFGYNLNKALIESTIYVTSKSGTITLNNFVSRNVKVTTTEKSPITVSYQTVDESKLYVENEITTIEKLKLEIVSGSGDTNLYMPIATGNVYYIYAIGSNVSLCSDVFILDDGNKFIEAGECRIAIAGEGETNKTINPTETSANIIQINRNTESGGSTKLYEKQN